MNYKGGYQILDITGYDLSVDENNKLTNEKTKNYLLNFAKYYNRKPILFKGVILGYELTLFCMVQKFADTDMLFINGGVNDINANFGLTFQFTIDYEHNEIIYNEAEY